MLRRRLRLGLRAEAGYSLMELITVMAILGIILTALTSLFVQGSSAELGQNRRFQAQVAATTALARLRRDVHCASSITPAGAAASITLTQPTGCPGGGGSIKWCTSGSGTRYGLYRTTGATCDSTGRLWADYLTVANAFNFTAAVQAVSLAKLHVDLTINVNPAQAVLSYPLSDDIVLRNSLRG
jgi:prepilin-type N-terminal cleavage/methylation domain-containing protein